MCVCVAAVPRVLAVATDEKPLQTKSEGPDVGPDVGPDAGPDAGPDVGPDAGPAVDQLTDEDEHGRRLGLFF